MGSSIRDVDTIAFTSNIKYLPIFKLITFTAPDLFGNPSTLNLWSGAGLYDNLTVFLGIIPFMLFFSSFFHTYSPDKRKRINFFRLIFLISLFLATKNPISLIIGKIQFLGFSSMVMTRFTVLMGLSVAYLSANVIDEILAGRSKFVNWRATFLLSFGMITLYLLVSKGIYIITERQISQLFFDTNTDLPDLLKFAHVAFRNSAIPIIITSFTTILLSILFYRQGKNNKRKLSINQLVVAILCLLTFFELFRFFQKYNTFTKPEYLYPQTPITDYLINQPGRFARESGEILPSNTWLPYEIYSPSGYDTLHSLRYNQFLSLIAGDHLTDTSSRYAEIKKFNNQLLNFLGVSNIVAVKRTRGVPEETGELASDFQSEDFPIVFENKKVAIVHNSRAFPLVYSVVSSSISGSIQETERLLLNSDLRHTVVLEKDPQIEKLSLANVKNLTISPQKIDFSTFATSSSIIVTSTTYDSGWHLLIDGKEKEIYIANHAFIGFPIPSGEHKIELYYYPESLNTGLLISAGSLLFSIFSLIYLSRWKKDRS